MAAQAGGAAGTLTATGYTLVVPDDWFSIELEPGRAEPAIAALVSRQFAGIDNAPHLQRQARRELAQRAEAAWKAGGVELFVSLMQIAGVPVAGSLTTFLLPPPADAATPDELAAALAAGGDQRGGDQADGDRVSVVDLPAGRAVRLVRDTAAPPEWDGTAPAAAAGPGGREDEAGEGVVSREVQVFVPVPGEAGAWLLLAFAAPLAPLAGPMTGLFDAVSQTLRWSTGG